MKLNENYLLIGSVIVIAFLFMNGIGTQAAGGDAFADIGTKLMDAFTNLLDKIVSSPTILILLTITIILFVIFRK